MKIDQVNFPVAKSSVFEISDGRILGTKELSPSVYHNFRLSVSKNNAGIAAFDKKMYVIAIKENSKKLLKNLSDLGIKVSKAVKDPETIKQVIMNENKLLRKFL